MKRAPRLWPLLLAAPALAGCGLFGRPEQAPVEGILAKPDTAHPQITVGELDQLSRNYADRLVARTSSACDRIKRENGSDEERRSKAHHLKLSIAMAAYDIVTDHGGSPQVPGAAQHVIDLLILTELEALRWVDEGAAKREFGESGGDALVQALQQSREDVGQLASRFLPEEQMDTLRTLVVHWRAKNPQVEWLARVRFDVLAQGQEGFRRALGQTFNPVRAAIQSVDDMRIVGQQALFYLHRLPLLLNWTMEATLSDALAIPKVDGLVNRLQESLKSVSQTAGLLGQLLEPSSQEPAINSTLREVKDSLVAARGLLQDVRQLEEVMHPLLENYARTAETGKKTDYEALASRLGDAAQTATTFVRETRSLAESPDAVKNVDDLLAQASRDFGRSGRRLIDHAAWRAVEVVLLIAVLIAAFVGVRYWIRRRRAAPAHS